MIYNDEDGGNDAYDDDGDDDVREISWYYETTRKNAKCNKDADFLVADSKYMKVAFGDGFKMLLFNPLVISMKDLSRNLKLTVSNSSLGEDC
ncbi:hypothetical protein Tco_0589248 [Tanacetum coccineum]